jgi:hypothetical protein
MVGVEEGPRLTAVLLIVEVGAEVGEMVGAQAARNRSRRVAASVYF